MLPSSVFSRFGRTITSAPSLLLATRRRRERSVLRHGATQRIWFGGCLRGVVREPCVNSCIPGVCGVGTMLCGVGKIVLNGRVSWAPMFLQKDIILKPNRTKGPAAVLFFIQGAQIPNSAYLPLVAAIREAYDAPLWVGIPAFWLEIPEPLVLKAGIDRVNASLIAAGMPPSLPVFFAGHSLGGAMIQNFVNTAKPSPLGQILMGAFLTHTYDDLEYPVPTLTLGGELDGLCRCTRVAENWFRYIGNRSATAYTSTFPVVIIPGMSHMQFASGSPPELVFQRDLRPAISYAAAHAAAAQNVAAFLNVRMNLQRTASLRQLQAQVDATGTFSKPIIAALKLEGYWQFAPPCFSAKAGERCTFGSPWVSFTAQGALGQNVAGVHNQDQFDDASDSSPLPTIQNHCSSASCVVDTTSVTQLKYNILTALDTGFVPISASEMETKMNSRQAIELAHGATNPSFNATDGAGTNDCAGVNQRAWAYALSNGGAATVTRFRQLGQNITIGDDVLVSSVSSWVGKALSMTTAMDAGSSRAVLRVSSPAIAFPDSSPGLKGLHFCKLLSPARAMEWLYVDGLRYYDSLANHTHV